MTANFNRVRSPHLSRRHRRVGAISAAFVIFIVASGLILNHTERLGLDRHYVNVGALLDWYNIHAPRKQFSFPVAGAWVSQLDERVYFSTRPIEGVAGPLVGAVAVDGQIYLAAAREVLVLTADGTMVEKLTGVDGIPAELTALGTTADGRIAIDGGGRQLFLTAGSLEIGPRNGAEQIRWSTPAPPPAPLAAELDAAYRGTGLTLERVLLDLHSGRIFGRLGVAVVDLVACFFLFLALSGLWMWWGRSANGERPRPDQNAPEP